MRALFEWWILPIVNPDGVIAGNYRCNVQGKDMNRHFFADGDPEANRLGRCAEVEILRNYLRNNLSGSMKVGETLQLFLDIHAHSVDTSIFAYAPLSDDTWTQLTTRRWS